MKLVIIIGPKKKKKMTVGQALAKRSGLKLFHNHMTIELVSELFGNNPKEYHRLVALFRKEIFEAYAKTDELGLIFTYMWAFDQQDDWDYIANLERIFTDHGATVYYVELEADFDLRLERNKTENRLLHKPSKRNLKWSEGLFLELEKKYRLNSLPGEMDMEHYIRIDNTALEPEEVVDQILQLFDL